MIRIRLHASRDRLGLAAHLGLCACAFAAASSCGGGGDGITVHEGETCAPASLSVPGSASGTLTTSGCVTNFKPARFYKFTSNGQGVVSFTATAAFAPEIAVTNDPPTEFVTFSGATTVTGSWILPTGTYQLRLASTAGTVGTFSITGINTTATGCAQRAILPFASRTYSASLATTDCVLAADHSYYDSFLIYSTKPCTITMHGVLASFDSYLIANNATTHEDIGEDDNSGGNKDAKLTFAACNSGGDPIEIWPNSYTDAVGDYTLTVAVTGGNSVRRE